MLLAQIKAEDLKQFLCKYKHRIKIDEHGKQENE